MKEQEPFLVDNMHHSVEHPIHYNTGGILHRECGKDIECIDVVQHFNFNRGNAIKYIWRAGAKDPDKEIEDLEKAIKYLEFEIGRLVSSGKFNPY